MKIRQFFAVFLCICLLLTACGAETPADKEAAMSFNMTGPSPPWKMRPRS